MTTALVINNETHDALPSGWRKVITNDGTSRVYYQNDITKQTQWNKPSSAPPPTEHRTVIQSTDNKERTSETFVPKWHDTRNIIFIVTSVLTIWDVYTDFYAGIAWMNLNYKQCESKFKCVYSKGSAAAPFGVLFIIFAILGFLSAVIGKYIQSKELLYIYNHCKTQDEVQQREAKCFKSSLKWDMVSFLIEDTTAIVMVTIAAGMFGDNDNKLSKAMLQSAITSVFIMIGVWANTWRNRLKFSSFLQLSDKICHCACWCCCFCIVILLGMVSLLVIYITSRKSFSEPFVSLNTDPKDICHLGFPDEDDYFVDGKVLEFPEYVFQNCSGDRYTYDIVCNLTGVRNKYIDDDLKCELSFYYDIIDTSSLYAMECDNNNYENGSMISHCDFNIVKGTCEMHTIECSNNVSFYAGNATMFACFDYCSF